MKQDGPKNLWEWSANIPFKPLIKTSVTSAAYNCYELMAVPVKTEERIPLTVFMRKETRKKKKNEKKTIPSRT